MLIKRIATCLFKRNNVGTQVGQKGKQLLDDYTRLVTSKRVNPKDFASTLQKDLASGEMANFNIMTGERIKYPKSVIKNFQAYQA
ncbi:MAG: hypothetical protein MJ231_04710 [bacterium]|nr:hypothetical protein [bacterium]